MNVCIGFPRGKLFRAAIQIMKFRERSCEVIKVHWDHGRKFSAVKLECA